MLKCFLFQKKISCVKGQNVPDWSKPEWGKVGNHLAKVESLEVQSLLELPPTHRGLSTPLALCRLAWAVDLVQSNRWKQADQRCLEVAGQ